MGVVAMGMRLLGRFDDPSHVLGVHLFLEVLPHVSAAQLQQFAEWIIPQLFVNINVVSAGFTRFFFTRLLQALLATTSQSPLLLRHSFKYLHDTLRSVRHFSLL